MAEVTAAPTQVVRITKDMLDSLTNRANPALSTEVDVDERVAQIKYDIGNLTSYVSIDVDFQQAKYVGTVLLLCSRSLSPLYATLCTPLSRVLVLNCHVLPT